MSHTKEIDGGRKRSTWNLIRVLSPIDNDYSPLFVGLAKKSQKAGEKQFVGMVPVTLI